MLQDLDISDGLNRLGYKVFFVPQGKIACLGENQFFTEQDKVFQLGDQPPRKDRVVTVIANYLRHLEIDQMISIRTVKIIQRDGKWMALTSIGKLEN